MASKQWEQVLSSKKMQLAKLDLPTGLNVTDYNVFKAYLDDFCIKYASKRVARLVRDKFAPHLEHIRSFADAITSTVQANAYASIIWGCIRAILEVNSPASRWKVLTLTFTVRMPICRIFVWDLQFAGRIASGPSACSRVLRPISSGADNRRYNGPVIWWYPRVLHSYT